MALAPQNLPENYDDDPKPKAKIEYSYAVYQCAPCEKTWAALINHNDAVREEKKCNDHINNNIKNKRHKFEAQKCPKCKDDDLVDPSKIGYLEGYENNEYYYIDNYGLKWQRYYAVYQCADRNNCSHDYKHRTTWTCDNIWITKMNQQMLENTQINIDNVIDENNYQQSYDKGVLTLYDYDANDGDACVSCKANQLPRNPNDPEEMMRYEEYKDQVLKYIKLIQNAQCTEDLIPMTHLVRRLGHFECERCTHRWVSFFTWHVPFVEVGWYQQDCYVCLQETMGYGDGNYNNNHNFDDVYNYGDDDNKDNGLNGYVEDESNFYKVYPIASGPKYTKSRILYKENLNGRPERKRNENFWFHKEACHYCMLLPKSCPEMYYERKQFRRLARNEYIGNYRGRMQIEQIKKFADSYRP